MKCFYHSSDLDGICSAAIVKHKHPECECISINYGYDKEIFAGIEIGETIYMVDFSAERSDMEKINLSTDNFIWIDHHVTAIEKCDGLKIKGIREVGKAGCELTWGHLFPEKFIPNTVLLLGRYDVWDHSDERALPFQYGMRNENLRPESKAWKTLLQDSKVAFKLILQMGHTIYNYQQSQNEIFANGTYVKMFHRLQALCINRAYTNSQVFDSVYNSEIHDIMLTYAYDGDRWRYSLYSTKPEIDVSEIAKFYDGGGHKGAAGFILDHLHHALT